MEKVCAGDRFVATHDIPTSALTSWKAPATFGFDTVVPEGTVLVATDDAVAGAQAFACVPERYEALERGLVPEQDRLHPKYGGHYFVFERSEIGRTLHRL